MVPRNILQRTFLIRHGASFGSAFALEVDQKQYLLTAKHMVAALQPPWPLEIFQHGAWRPLPLTQVWQSTSGADVAVLCPGEPLFVALPVTASNSPNFWLSERVYFLGFPFGLSIDVGPSNNGYPIPFVKTGIVAGFTPRSASSQIIFLDGHNNSGFSGGPVVTVSASEEVTVIGIVCGYRATDEPILLPGGLDTGLRYRTNEGLVVAYGMREPLDFISTSNAGAAIA